MLFCQAHDILCKEKGEISMKYSTRLSDAVHILSWIELNPIDNLSSQSIATSLYTNPSFVRQIMKQLKDASLIISVSGHAKPRLAKHPSEITLLDVYKAVEKDKPLLHLNTHTNPECGVGIHIQLALQEYYDEIQKHVEITMKTITLEDVMNTYKVRINDIN